MCWAIWVKLPLASGRPKKVTVIGSASGSVTPTLSVGDVLIPVPALAGALRVGAAGAPPPAAGTKPDTQDEPVPVMVPLAAVAMESPTDVPDPSLRPQRATRLVPEVSSEFIVVWIWPCVWATLQTRASSMTPWKRPTADPVEVIIAPSATRWIESERGTTPGLTLASRLPSR